MADITFEGLPPKFSGEDPNYKATEFTSKFSIVAQLRKWPKESTFWIFQLWLIDSAYSWLEEQLDEKDLSQRSMKDWYTALCQRFPSHVKSAAGLVTIKPLKDEEIDYRGIEKKLYSEADIFERYVMNSIRDTNADTMSKVNNAPSETQIKEEESAMFQPPEKDKETFHHPVNLDRYQSHSKWDSYVPPHKSNKSGMGRYGPYKNHKLPEKAHNRAGFRRRMFAKKLKEKRNGISNSVV